MGFAEAEAFCLNVPTYKILSVHGRKFYEEQSIIPTENALIGWVLKGQ